MFGQGQGLNPQGQGQGLKFVLENSSRPRTKAKDNNTGEGAEGLQPPESEKGIGPFFGQSLIF